MENTTINKRKRGMTLPRVLATFMMAIAAVFGLSAQNSLPAPGTGGSYHPSPIGGGGGWGGGFGPSWGAPGPPPPSSWGGAWGPGWGYSPTIIVNSPSWTDSGSVNVMACGYDAQGIWRDIPMRVRYHYNGVDYNVTVKDVWNPWTNSWMKHVDQPAYNTDYYHYNGVDYNVTVKDVWNPWTNSWMKHVDQPAYNTDYYLRGNTYDFYAPLSIGTFYFNL